MVWHCLSVAGTRFSCQKGRLPGDAQAVARVLALVGFCVLLAGCRGDATAELTEQLVHGDVAARRQAAKTLGRHEGQLGPAVAALAQAAADRDAEVRRLACVALGRAGQDARAASAAVAAALDDREYSVRLAAALALQRIDPQGKAYVPTLVAAMKTGEGGVIVAVGQTGTGAQWAVPTLIGLLRDHRPGTRRIAADALAQIRPTAAEARRALAAAARDRDDRVREAAQEALAAIGKGT